MSILETYKDVSMKDSPENKLKRAIVKTFYRLEILKTGKQVQSENEELKGVFTLGHISGPPWWESALQLM